MHMHKKIVPVCLGCKTLRGLEFIFKDASQERVCTFCKQMQYCRSVDLDRKPIKRCPTCKQVVRD